MVLRLQYVEFNLLRCRAALSLLGVCLILATAPTARGQGTPKAKAPAAKGAPSAPARPAAPAGAAAKTPPAAYAAPQWTSDEAAARERVLKGQAFGEMMHEFEQWLSAQTIYDAAEVKQIRARLGAGLNRMNAPQLERFTADMQEKLQVLTSAPAQQAGAYLVQTFSVASPAYAKRLREKLPDVLTMTAAQINQQLAVFASKHQATLAMQQTFDSARQQEITYNEQQLAAQAQASQAALDRASAGAAAAGSRGGNYSQARDYFPDAGNDGPFGPGTSISFGWGFF